jgi:hypothetical protein
MQKLSDKQCSRCQNKIYPEFISNIYRHHNCQCGLITYNSSTPWCRLFISECYALEWQGENCYLSYFQFGEDRERIPEEITWLPFDIAIDRAQKLLLFL